MGVVFYDVSRAFVSSDAKSSFLDALHIMQCDGKHVGKLAMRLGWNALSGLNTHDDSAEGHRFSVDEVLFFRIITSYLDTDWFAPTQGSLTLLHRRLCDGIIASAGEVRTRDVIKRGTPLAPARDVSRLLDEVMRLRICDLQSGVYYEGDVFLQMAIILSLLHYAHPFAQRNMPALRVFMRCLCLSVGWNVSLYEIPPATFRTLIAIKPSDEQGVRALARAMERHAAWT